MATFDYPGSVSGRVYRFDLQGETPTVDERRAMDARVLAAEQEFLQGYNARFGTNLTAGSGGGIGSLLGSAVAGVGAGAAGLLESGALGAATLLPEEYEAPTREFIRGLGYSAQRALAPDPDLGTVGQGVRAVSEGLGSFLPLLGAGLFGPVGIAGAGALAVGAGAGEASERARAGDATEDERAISALLGAGVGVTELLPVSRFVRALQGAGVNAPGALARIGRIAREGGVEAAQEAAAELLQNAISLGIYDPSQDLTEGLLPAAGVGGSVGAIVQGIVELATRGRSRGVPGAEAPPEQLLLPPPSAFPPPDQINVPPTGPEPVRGQPGSNVPGGYGIQPGDSQAAPAAGGLQTDPIVAELNTQFGERAAIYEFDNGMPRDLAEQLAARDVLAQPVVAAAGSRMADAFMRRMAQLAEGTPPASSPDPLAGRFAPMDAYAAEFGPAPTAPLFEPRVVAEQAQEAIVPPTVVPGRTPPQRETQVRQPLTDAEINSVLDRLRAEGRVTLPLIQSALPQDRRTPAEARAVRDALAEREAIVPAGGAGQFRLAPEPQAQEIADVAGELEPRADRVRDAAPAQAAGEPAAGAPPADVPAGRGPAGAGEPDAGGLGGAPVGAVRPEPAEGAVSPALTPQPTAPAAPLMAPPQPAQGGLFDVPPAQAPAQPAVQAPASQQGATPAPTGPVADAAPQPGAPSPAPEVVTPAEPPRQRRKRQTKAEKDAAVAAAKEKAEAASARRGAPSPEAQTAPEADIAQAVRARWAGQPKVLAVVLAHDLPGPEADRVSTEDAGSVARLLQAFADGRQPKRGAYSSLPDARAAYEYFSRFSNPSQALDTIAWDSATGKWKKEGKGSGRPEGALPAAEQTYFGAMTLGQGRAAARWAEQNLSPAALERMKRVRADLSATRVGGVAYERVAAKAQLSAATREQVQREEDNEARALLRQLAREKAEQERDQQRKPTLPTTPFPLGRPANVYADLAGPLHPTVLGAIANNDVPAALRALAATFPDARVAALARAMADRLGATRIMLVDPNGELGATLVSPDGAVADGGYFPAQDLIVLNKDAPALTTVLLHEAGHAATAKRVADDAAPVSRELDLLAEELRGMNVVDPYFVSNRFELLAEGMANPQFRATLAGVFPKGGPKSALQRFTDAVKNFLRSILPAPLARVLGPRASALDTLDRIIDTILTPETGPVTPTELGNLAFPEMLPRVATSFMAAQRGLAGPENSRRQRFLNAATSLLTETIPQRVKTAALGLTPLAPLVDLANYYKVKGAAQLAQAMRRLESAAIPSVKAADAVLKRATEWAKANPQQEPLLNEIAHESTTYGVNPLLSQAEARARYTDPEQFTDWQRVKAAWGRLNSTGRDIYTAMLNHYKNGYEDVRKALFGEIDGLVGDNATLGAEVKRRLLGRIFNENRIDPFFPLWRKGDYWLIFDAIDPRTNQRETVKELYETELALKQAEASLAKLPPGVLVPDTVRTAARGVFTEGRGTIGDLGAFSDILRLLEQGRVPENVREQVVRRIIDAMPETSFARSMARREGVPGARGSAIEAFRVKGYSLARQAARYNHLRAVRDFRQQVADEARNELMTSRSQVIGELTKRADFALNSPQSLWEDTISAVNRGAFTMTIGGGNVSSALVNLSALPLIVHPYLAAEYGVARATRALLSAGREFGASGISQELILPSAVDGSDRVTVRGLPSIDNFYTVARDGTLAVRDVPGMPAKLKTRLEELTPLVQAAMRDNQLNRSLFYDSMAIEQSGQERGLFEKITAIGGLPFHLAERMNRQVTMLAAYDLELQRLRENADMASLSAAERRQREAELRQRAAEAALDRTREVNGGATLSEAPRYAQTGIGRMALMFKTYAIQMLAMQLRAAKQVFNPQGATSAEDRRLRQIGLRRLVGVNLTLGFWAGLAGTPIIGAAQALMEALDLFGLLSDEDETAEQIMQSFFGNELYYGWFGEALGVDLSSRVGLNLFEMLSIGNRYAENPSPEEWAVQALGGPAASVASQFWRGGQEFAAAVSGGGQGTESVYRAIEGSMPPILRNGMRALRYNEEGALTRRGVPITDNLSSGNVFSQLLGFAPTTVTRAQTESRNLLRRDESLTQRRVALMRRYYFAIRQGNFLDAQEILEEIQQFNSASSTPPAYQISGDSIRQSVRQHFRTTAEMHNGVTLSAAMRRTIAENLAAQRGGYNLY